MGDYGVGSDDAVMTYGDAGHDDDILCNPNVIFNRYGTFGIERTPVRGRFQTVVVGAPMGMVRDENVTAHEYAVADGDAIDDADVNVGIECDVVADDEFGGFFRDLKTFDAQSGK